MLVLEDRHSNLDRRACPRVRVNRPCKVHDPRSGKYLAGTTRDLSSGGALVEFDRPLEIGSGESLFVGIAQKRRQMFIRSCDMIEFRVLRALRTSDGRTIVAGRWAEASAAAEPMRMAA